MWTLHARRQFEMVSEQTKELTVLEQKIAAKALSRALAASPGPSRKPLDLSICWACDAHDRLYL